MRHQTKATAMRAAFAAFSVAAACAAGGEKAGAGERYAGAPVFDIDARKKTGNEITDWAAYSAYASVRYSGERNLRLDDGRADYSDKYTAYLGLTARVEPDERFVGFAHLEAELTERRTHRNEYSIRKIHRKELVAAYRLSERSAISVGRMRFSDAQNWSADAAVDGAHYGFKGDDLTIDLAAFAGTYDDEGRYALAHISRFTETETVGALAILESDSGEERAHLSAYWSNTLSGALSYTAVGGVTLGDAANGLSFGAAGDVRVIAALGEREWNPQLTLGLAAGTSGFRQTGIESHKTYDGGQTQFHRNGYVYQPELTNMAVASVGLGLRPSRMFSLDLTARAYAQIKPTAGVPDARVSGETTGRSALLGGELSLVGAWRPTTQTKLEIGMAVFQPGPAYENRGAATQAYARFSVYF